MNNKNKKGMHRMPDGSMMKNSDMQSGYGHGGSTPKRKPYKYGGHNVPGMFQEGGAPKKRNMFGRIGAGIGNIFRNDANDRSIKYQGYKNPQVGSGPKPNFSIDPTTGGGGRTSSRPFKGGMGKRGRNFYHKSGGSVGPNGTL